MLGNPRQVQFIVEYLKDGNASRAALAVGYKSKGIGAALLKRPGIKYEVERQLEMIQKAARVSKTYVVSKLVDVAERSMTAEPVMMRGEDGKMVESGEYQFDSTGANRALELLGKTLGIFLDKSVTVTMTLEQLVELSMVDDGPLNAPSGGTPKIVAG